MKIFSSSKIYSRLLMGAGLVAFALLVMASPSSTQAATISQQLEVGSRGADVSTLQTFLSQDRALYPEALVTGYFGSLTKSAVTNFQLRNEIPSVGRVGPMTLPIINLQITTGMYPGMGVSSVGYPGTVYTGADISAPVIGNVTVSTSNGSATVNWATSEGAQGRIYYSVTPLVMSEQLNSVSISGAIASMDSQLRFSQVVTILGLQANTTYYYAVYSTDAAGNVSITWPSTFRTN